MAKPIGAELPEEIVAHLSGGHPCAIATIDAAGRPYLSIMAGVVALNSTTLRMGCWGTGITAQNIAERRVVTVETLGPRAISIQCTTRLIRRPMEHSMFPPHPYTLFEAHVEFVKDDAPPGLQITPMAYSYGKRAEQMIELEASFLEELITA